jgi:hypothetical protein
MLWLIAVWQTIDGDPSEATEWWFMMQRLYLNASYADLLFVDEHTNKPVFFVPQKPSDPTIVDEIEAYGIVVGMLNDVPGIALL